MKNIKYLFLFLMMSCASSRVVTDYDDKVDFLKYTTFDFYEDNGENLNEFDVKRITASIYDKLTASGFHQNKKPTFFIYFNTETTEALNRNTLGIGIGTGGNNSSIGISGGIPIGGKKLNENIIIKFIDASSNALFWEASLSSVIKEKRKPEERKLFLQKVVTEILDTYPPKNKTSKN